MPVRILLDNCVWGGVKPVLEDAGYDVIWVGDLLEDPGDEAILRFANRENRILITLDKDFGELAIFRKEPHCGIIRIVNQSVSKQVETSLQILATYKNDLIGKSIITVDNLRVRIRAIE